MAETNFIPVRGNDINNTSVENGQFLINPATKRAYIDAPVRDGAAAERTMLYGDAVVKIENNGNITKADGSTSTISLGKTYTGESPINIDNTNNKISVGKATTGDFGVVKIGRGLTTDNDGAATIHIGTGLALSDAAADDGGKLYCTVTDTWHLNKADSEGYVLKSGANYNAVWMAGPNSSDPNPQWRPLPKATTNSLGVVKIGEGLSVDSNGVVKLNYELPVASATVLGGIKVGTKSNVTQAYETNPFWVDTTSNTLQFRVSKNLDPLDKPSAETPGRSDGNYWLLAADKNNRICYLSQKYSQVTYSSNSGIRPDGIYKVVEHNQINIDRSSQPVKKEGKVVDYEDAMRVKRITKYLNFEFNYEGVTDNNKVVFTYHDTTPRDAYYMHANSASFAQLTYNFGSGESTTKFSGAPFVVCGVICTQYLPITCIVSNVTAQKIDFTLFSQKEINTAYNFSVNFILYGVVEDF